MNTFFNKFKKEALNIKLSSTEKQILRARIYKEMGSTQKKIKSPYGAHFWFMPRMATSIAMLLVITLVSGTAFAAESSLPGEPLYQIKVHVNERVAGALAFTDEARAELHTQLAEVRLEEAEKLASLGKLDAEKSAEIEDSFDEHVQHAEAIEEKIRGNDPDTSNQLATKRNASLRALDSILVRVGKEGSDDNSNKLANEMAIRVRTRGENKKSATLSSLSSVTTTMSIKESGGEIKENKALPKARKTATDALQDSKDKFNEIKESFDSNTITRVQTQLNLLSNKLISASSVEEYTQILQDATVLKAFLKASKKLNRNFLSKTERINGNSTDDVKKIKYENSGKDTGFFSQNSPEDEREENEDSFIEDLLRD